MPLFEYSCKNGNCEYTHEYLLNNGETPGPCPECGGELEKQLSTFSAHTSGKTNHNPKIEENRLVTSVVFETGSCATIIPIDPILKPRHLCGDEAKKFLEVSEETTRKVREGRLKINNN